MLNKQPTKKTDAYRYLGDSVAIDCLDGWHLTLYTEDGNDNVIHLNGDVLERLYNHIKPLVEPVIHDSE